MFTNDFRAGGSAVCCVDEVSTGLDPISRRRIWEILLTERANRTIILTTHYLDEADFLADDIAIMLKGNLRASGTSASLKHSYGDGYTVKLPYQSDVQPQVSGQIHREQSRHQTVFRVATPALAAELVEDLEKHKLEDYQLSGPTMEELFIKITGETMQAANKSSTNEKDIEPKAVPITVKVEENDYELTEGRPISVFKQWWILVLKRFRILPRRWIPYLVAVAFAIAGAGVAPLLIKSVTQPIKCPAPADLINDYRYRYDFGSKQWSSDYYGYSGDSLYRQKYVFGPGSSLDQNKLDLMAHVYSVNYTLNYGYENTVGYRNSSQLRDQLLLVNTYDEFQNVIRDNWKAVGEGFGRNILGYVPYASLAGGIWLGDAKTPPAVLVNARNVDGASQMLNMYNVMAGGVGISSSYYSFASIKVPDLINLKPLMFIIYFGLIMAW